MQFFFFVAVIVVVIFLVVLSHQAAKRRREALLALARELGWRFIPGADRSHDDVYAHFEIFRRGHSRQAFNTMIGTVEIDERHYSARAGDYRYTITSGSGKSRSSTTYHISYLILHSPFPHTMPSLLIRPEGIMDKIAGAIGWDDIDFESAEFSRRFYVKSTDKRFAYDVIDPRMMEYLLSSNPPVIEIERGQCLVLDGRRQWEPAELHRQIRWTLAFLDLFPDHVMDLLDEVSGRKER